MNTETKQRGFTIVEMIVAIAIFSILIMLIVLVSTQILAMTTKMQSRDKAMAIAQQHVEQMRGSLIVPYQPVPIPDSTWPEYTVTITSALVADSSGTSTYVKFLREVFVRVQSPYGQSPVELHTYIQTYRPQVSFIFPVTNIAYIRNVDPLLEGWVRDDGNTITKVEYRLGSAGSWTPLTSFYLDVNRLNPATLPVPVGQTVFFTIPIVGGGSDGTIQEIQVQATNSENYTNEQPSQPFGGTSYVRLITDKTKPTATIELIPTTSITTGSTPTFRVTASDTTSGVNGVFVVVSKIDSGGTKTYLHETVPYWASGIYYNTATSSDLQYQFVLPTGTLADEPWTEYSFRAYVLDNVIGKYYDYLKLIPPTQPISPGVDYLWPNVTANFYETATITRTMHPSPELTITTSTATTITATTATLYGSVNPGGLDSSVWFEYKPISESQWIATATISENSVALVDFAKEVLNLLPATQYQFRAYVHNDWGTFHGLDITFTTTAGITP